MSADEAGVEAGAGAGEPGGGRGALRRPVFLASAAFLVVVALLAGWIAVDQGGDDTVGTGEQASAQAGAGEGGEGSAGAPASGTDGAGGSVCGLGAGDQAVPAVAPPARVETVAAGVSVPVADGAGPGIRDGGISRCFAHSPSGALLASANWLRWFSSQQRLDEVIVTLMAPGQDRDRLAGQVADGWDGSTTQPAPIRGFKIDVRGPDEVVVTLAVASTGAGGQGLVAWPVLMRWVDGDWKAVAPSNNSWGQESVESLALGGFTVWGID
ncbi:hypothetical protein SAMN05216246_11239 [Actinomyces denticolens]|uniref:DUF8175 domain-containing protein n=1 Tax=Actinomyces denticolens TaxID=52767 RepID=A0ABY1IGF5_9ACTO|nr:hypothetical protein [Actinomyces denticolens]SHJ13801.1 hypothetical protein SAMN05216246_11239 [Actinomyces denticolens]